MTQAVSNTGVSQWTRQRDNFETTETWSTDAQNRKQKYSNHVVNQKYSNLDASICVLNLQFFSNSKINNTC